MQARQNSAEDQSAEIGLKEVVLGWPRAARVFFGMFSCAFVAHYLPLLIVAATGRYTQLIFSPLDIAIEGGGLIVISCIGFFTRRIWLIGLAFCVLFGIYEVQHYLRAPMSFTLGSRWQEIFDPIGSLLLNAYLFNRYCRWLAIFET